MLLQDLDDVPSVHSVKVFPWSYSGVIIPGEICKGALPFTPVPGEDNLIDLG